jgi:hypothetical protein
MLIYHFFHTLTCHERGGDVLPGAVGNFFMQDYIYLQFYSIFII